MSPSTPSPPSILVSQHQRYQSPQPLPSFTASPVSIRGTQEGAPPPLPPPRELELSAGRDPGWQWGNDSHGSDFGRLPSVKSGSSLLGSAPKRQKQEKEGGGPQHDMDQREGLLSTVDARTCDQDMSDDRMTHSEPDLLSKFSAGYRLHGEKPLEQRTLNSSSHDYDKQMLSKIGGPNTPKRQSLSYPSGISETAQHANAEVERRNASLRLTVPDVAPERHNSVDLSPYSHSHSGSSLSRWSSNRSPGAISPLYGGFWEHSPGQLENNSRTHTRQSSVNFDDSSSHRSSYDHSMFVSDDYIMEDSQMSNLNIHDRSPCGSDDQNTGGPAGTKRRALSPPGGGMRDERPPMSSSGNGDLHHRRSMQQLPKSPVSRHRPNNSSMSSASSIGPRQGSLSSSIGGLSIPSSATSYASGRISPGGLSATSTGGLSPGVFEPDLRAPSPYSNTKSLLPSPIATNPQHHRAFPEAAQAPPRKMSIDSTPRSRGASMSHMQGYICECCPKKPRKFDTEDELRQHEAEKQYACAYCPNRFKNKNEAERHQNSLHLRLHSWSCAALQGPQAAFHTSPTSDSLDVCGYCGEEFPNPAVWEKRADHLNHVHKFGECNQAKKFFRADHFRQHLKHSHAGTSGRWTNMLETACMRDEPPPEKRVSRGADHAAAAAAPGGHPLPQLTISTVGLTGPSQGASTLHPPEMRNA
ncbi:hypothetical protein MBLNU230_g1579t1 [Neophaeotheca triangularis]